MSYLKPILNPAEACHPWWTLVWFDAYDPVKQNGV